MHNWWGLIRPKQLSCVSWLYLRILTNSVSFVIEHSVFVSGYCTLHFVALYRLAFTHKRSLLRWFEHSDRCTIVLLRVATGPGKPGKVLEFYWSWKNPGIGHIFAILSLKSWNFIFKLIVSFVLNYFLLWSKILIRIWVIWFPQTYESTFLKDCLLNTMFYI